MLLDEPRLTDLPRAHFSEAELDRRWHAAITPRDGAIHALVARRGGGGAHELPARAPISVEHGLAGDRWYATSPRDPEAQLSLIDLRIVRALIEDARELHVPGDNLVVDLDLGVAALPVGAELAIGAVVLAITAKPHTGCVKFRARLGGDALRWVNAAAARDERRRGVFARVITGGTIGVGDRVVAR
ncbi:MAG: hypothetical protein K8W52_11685 [Deltaproteobacteria bacterium]|nr:hypothetical protein [Deltaproteobacteria bacterium]